MYCGKKPCKGESWGEGFCGKGNGKSIKTKPSKSKKTSSVGKCIDKKQSRSSKTKEDQATPKRGEVAGDGINNKCVEDVCNCM